MVMLNVGRFDGSGVGVAPELHVVCKCSHVPKLHTGFAFTAPIRTIGTQKKREPSAGRFTESTRTAEEEKGRECSADFGSSSGMGVSEEKEPLRSQMPLFTNFPAKFSHYHSGGAVARDIASRNKLSLSETARLAADTAWIAAVSESSNRALYTAYPAAVWRQNFCRS